MGWGEWMHSRACALYLVLLWPLSTQSYCPFEPLMWPFICLAQSHFFRLLSLAMGLFFLHWHCWFIHLMFHFVWVSVCLFVCFFSSSLLFASTFLLFFSLFGLLSPLLFLSHSSTSISLINAICRLSVVAAAMDDVHTCSTYSGLFNFNLWLLLSYLLSFNLLFVFRCITPYIWMVCTSVCHSKCIEME